MFWTQTHFPAAMRSLPPSVRAKAIEIANSLQGQYVSDQREVISTSIQEARSWSRRRFMESAGTQLS
ncbi:hypothetical protein LX87_03740 [Larkinella arboricola]|uniref:Uncharacterized protein n=1 Tax=Larkinella arboricola TaxID=643671 RepID=A0A327WU84_LARAB|nr:hypothetical protein LX87_03740 [Larkinella arboricola]